MLDKKTLFRYVLLLIAITSFSACGGSSDSSGTFISSGNNSEALNECVLSENESTISLESGESCEISSDLAQTFSISAGEISCNEGNLTFGGSVFSATNGVAFGDLTLICGA